MSNHTAQTMPVIDPIADALINRQVVEQHPHLKPVTDQLTTVCTYDGTPAVRVDTGTLGNRYGLCASCATSHDNMATAETATAAAAAKFRANNPELVAHFEGREHPDDELAIEAGRITPVGEQQFAEMTRKISAGAAATGDASAIGQIIEVLPEILPKVLKATVAEYSDELAALIVEDLTARLRAGAGQAVERPSTRPSATKSPNPVGVMLGITQCCARRPDRDQLTGHRLDGQEDTDETSTDRLLCIEQHDHNGDHRDALRRTWLRTAAEVTA